LRHTFTRIPPFFAVQGVTDELTAKGRAILQREKESFRGGGRIGETHTAFTMRRKEAKKTGLELNRFFGRGKAAAAGSSDAASKEEQSASLLAEERAERPAGPPLSRAEELKARLASKVEAVKGGAERSKSLWPSLGGGGGGSSSGAGGGSGGGSAAAATPAPAKAPAAPAAAPARAGASSSDSLDALFANLGKR
jgi:hypothetical protein